MRGLAYVDKIDFIHTRFADADGYRDTHCHSNFNRHRNAHRDGDANFNRDSHGDTDRDGDRDLEYGDADWDSDYCGGGVVDGGD